MLLFKRFCEIEVGKKGEVGKLFDQRFSADFAIDRTADPKQPDSMTLNLYNVSLSASDINTDYFCTVRAGYEDAQGVVYSGDIVFASEKIDGVDRVLTLDCGDGYTALKQAQVNKSFRAGTASADIVDEVVNAMKREGKIAIEKGKQAIIKLIKGDEPAGTTLKSIASDFLRNYLRKNNKTFKVENNELVIYDIGKSDQRKKIILTPKTGLIGSPTKDVKEHTEKGKPTQKINVVNFRALIQPGFTPGQIVNISSKHIDGDYIIERVRIAGETRGSNWYADCLAMEA